jgi:hypothetical protein
MPLSHPTLFTIHAAFMEDKSAHSRHMALTCTEAHKWLHLRKDITGDHQRHV